MSKIAVTAATGQLGRRVIKSLIAKGLGKDVIAVARNGAKAADLGVEVRVADYDDLTALERAFVGIEKVLLISSDAADKRFTHHSNVVAAAIKNGVKQLAYTSILHSEKLDVALASDHKRTEAHIKSSSLGYTILRNGWYWENNTSSLMSSLEHGAIVGSAGEGKISWASREDLAEAAAIVLVGNHSGQIYELAGDNAYTLPELAAETSRQIGKPLIYKNMTEMEHAGFYQSIGLPPGFSAVLAEVEARAMGTNQFQDDSRTLSKLIGRPTTTLEQAVADALK